METAEVAQVLGVSVVTVRHMVKRGVFKQVRKFPDEVNPRMLLFDPAEVETEKARREQRRKAEHPGRGARPNPPGASDEQ